MAYYAFLLANIYVMAECPGWEHEISDYTDELVFTLARKTVPLSVRREMFARVFG